MVTWMRGAGINHRVIGEMPFGPRLTGLELHAGSVLSEHFQSLGRMNRSSRMVSSTDRRAGVPSLKFVEGSRKATAGPSTALDAKNASNSAQDDSAFYDMYFRLVTMERFSYLCRVRRGPGGPSLQPAGRPALPMVAATATLSEARIEQEISGEILRLPIRRSD